jgi:hypothetical protein
MPSDEAIPYMALEVRSSSTVMLCYVMLCYVLFSHFFSCPLNSPSFLNCFLSVKADGNWETLEFGKSKVSGEYIVEEEPDDTRPNGVTR